MTTVSCDIAASPDRALLECLCQGPATAAMLGQRLGLSTTEICARLDALRAAGIEMRTHPQAGYRLAQPLELLDADAILSALAPAARAHLHSLTLSFDAASTQIQALSVPAPVTGCALWLAERQTAGQGRRGRAWRSPLAAQLSLSLSRRFRMPLAALSGLSLVIGLVAAETLRELDFAKVAVKWPNDLTVDGHKLGGILVHSRGAASGPCEAVIGLGINVRLPDDAALAIDQPWCDLAQLANGAAISRNTLTSALLARLLPALATFEQQGFAPFFARWPPLDALLGRTVQVSDGANNHMGQALGITDTGALRLAASDGERHFHSAEVSVRPA